MSFTHRFVRATPSGKVDDRFLTFQIARADDPAKLSLGTLFCLIEIKSRWFPTSQIAQTIVNTLRREYYKGTSTSDLENFENAIKKVNEQLASITQNGETEWVGNLNAELILLNGNDTHLCSAGNVRAFLLRDNKVIPISEPKKNDEEIPVLKTFSTITSGSLEDKDRLLVATSNLFDTVSIEDVRSAFQEPSIYHALLDLVKNLQRQKILNVSFGAIEILRQETAAGLPLGEPDVIYLDQPVENTGVKLRRITNSVLMPFLARAAVFGKKTAKQTAHLIKTKVVPASSKFAVTMHHHTRKYSAALVAKAKPIAQETLSKIKIKNPDPDKQIPGEETNSLIGKTIFNIHDYTQAKPAKKRLNIPLPSKLFLERIKIVFRQKRNRPLIYITTTIVLIFILVISVSIQKNNEKKQAAGEKPKVALEEAKRRLEEGKTALVFNNKSQAQSAFADAITQAKVALGTKFETDARSVIDQAETELDKLVGSNRLKNLAAAINFPGVNRIAVLNGKVAAIDTNANKVYIGDLVDGNVKTSTTQIEGGLATITTNNNQIIITTNKTIYALNTQTADLEKLNLAADAAVVRGVDAGTFADNLYILAPEDNQIWKYQSINSVFQKQTGYVKSRAQLGNAIDIAIDGAIYVLNSAGKISKFSQGNAQNFGLTGMPAGFENVEKPIAVVTAAENSSIYLVDAGSLPRILEFDKQGKFLQQFLFKSDLTDFKDLWVQPTGRKAWALFGNSVYELNL